MTRSAWTWFAFGAMAALVTVFGMATGAVPIAAAFLAGVGLLCAAHPPSRDFVLEKTLAALTREASMSAATVVLALLLIQTLPFDLAFVLAGDALAYIDVVAAVSLLALGARLAPLRASLKRRLARTGKTLPVRADASCRRRREPRQRRKPTREDDGEGRAPARAGVYAA